MIIPLHRRSPAFERSVEEAVAVAGTEHQVLVVADPTPGPLPDGATPVVSGAGSDTSPAEKRDLALAHADGDICAFLDDDAYPRPDWIDRALARFARSRDRGRRRPRGHASGTAVAGAARRRVLRVAVRAAARSGTASCPTATCATSTTGLLTTSSSAPRRCASVGGWGSRFYGGEDTKVCLDLVQAGTSDRLRPRRRRLPPPAADLRGASATGRQRRAASRLLRPRASRDIARGLLYFAPTAAALLAAAALRLWRATPARTRLGRRGRCRRVGAGRARRAPRRRGPGRGRGAARRDRREPRRLRRAVRSAVSSRRRSTRCDGGPAVDQRRDPDAERGASTSTSASSARDAGLPARADRDPRRRRGLAPTRRSRSPAATARACSTNPLRTGEAARRTGCVPRAESSC